MAKTTVAILYDFDKTLCTTDMQEYDFIKNLGLTPEEFWGSTGEISNKYEMDKIYKIISANHFNSNPPKWHCNECETYDWLNGSYITFVEEDDFLAEPSKYIDNAYDKSENDAKGYKLHKER